MEEKSKEPDVLWQTNAHSDGCQLLYAIGMEDFQETGFSFFISTLVLVKRQNNSLMNKWIINILNIGPLI